MRSNYFRHFVIFSPFRTNIQTIHTDDVIVSLIQVIPSRDQFVAVIFDDCCASMKSFMHQCNDDMMVDGHLWRKQAGESKLKFKVRLCASFSRSRLWNLGVPREIYVSVLEYYC